MIPPSCIRARRVHITLRHNLRDQVKTEVVVIPSTWMPSKFLRYVEACHPNETCSIDMWVQADTWIANPAAFSDYRTGELVSNSFVCGAGLPGCETQCGRCKAEFA